MLNIQSDKHTPTLFQLNGKTRIADLRKALNYLKFTYIEGNFAYQAKLTIPNSSSNEQNHLLITSNLKGAQINIPSPLKKPSNSSAPSTLQIDFSENQPPCISFNYNDQLKGILQYRSNQLDFDRGNIALGGRNVFYLNNKDYGLQVPYQNLIGRNGKTFFSLLIKKKIQHYNWPEILKKISLQFKNVQLFDQNFQNIQLDLSRDPNNWLLGITSLMS